VNDRSHQVPHFDSGSLLRARGLSCARNERVLFSNLTFELRAGKLLQVTGANGSGKTTLLRCLCGLFLAEEGEIEWCGVSIQRARSEYFGALRYVGHRTGIKEDLTPVENVTVDAVLSGRADGVTPFEALEQVGLASARDVPCRALSMGQRRRVGLARLLVSRAQLWILDEPLAALDHSGQKMVETLLKDHASAGGMVIFSSHQGLEFAAGTIEIDLGTS